MNERRPMIAVIGDATVEVGDGKAILAERTGFLVVSAGWRLLTGGLGGVMEAASRGARSSPAHQPGDIVGLLPSADPGDANPFVDVAIPTGLDHGRNLIVAQSDAVIAIGGGAGTLAEIAFAWIMKRPIVAFRIDGWSGRVADTRIDDRVRQPEVPDDRVFGADSAEDAIAIIAERLPQYTGRHHAVRRRT